MKTRPQAWSRFRANRLGFASLVLFAALFAASLCAGLYCENPHRTFPSSVLDPYLRPAASPPLRYPVAAAEYGGVLSGDGDRAGDTAVEPALLRAWGDTDRFAGAVSGGPPKAVSDEIAARLRGEARPAFEVAENGVSWRIPPTPVRRDGSPEPDSVRVYLRPADWRTAPGEPSSAAGGSALSAENRRDAVPLEPAVFPFRPVPGHPFGFDAAGRDVFSRVVYGARTAISFGLLLVAASLALGIAFGAVQGWFVRWVDVAGQRLTEIWSAIPFLYVMIFLGNAFGRSFGLLLAVYAAFNWIGVATYVRAEFLRLRTRPFVEAGRVQGLSQMRLMSLHVLPNAVTPLVTLFPFLLVGAIGSLAALDYLGFGLPDGAPSWGELLQEAQAFRQAWWLVLFPSLALFVTMLLGVFVGEALRDAFDPKPAFGLAKPVERECPGAGNAGREAAPDLPPRGSGPADGAKIPALKIEDLRVSFDSPQGRVRAVDGVSLEIAPGEALGLVGESGSGKSVTAMSILRLLPSPPARVLSGRISVCGRDVFDMRPEELLKLRGAAVGTVFQDPMTALSPLRRVGDQMLEALRMHRAVSRREGLAIAAEWLAKCGLADPERCLSEYPFRLSGGMQQRVMIASVLMTEPRLIVADEPTTALDATNRDQVLSLLETARSADTALLLVSHDMGVVRRACSRIAVMHDGHIVECGPAAEVFSSPRHPYARALVAAANRCGSRAPGAAAAPIPAGGCTMRAEGLSKRFGRLEVVKGATLELRRGEILALVGDSGCGKTTLMRMLAGLEQPDAGTVELDGVPLGFRRTAAQRRAVQMVFQDPCSSLNPRHTVEFLLSEAPVAHGLVPRGERATFARAWLERVGMPPDAAGRHPHEFSGGQLQRISIARALALRPSVLLLDEPVSALDVSVQAQILDLVLAVRRDFAPAMLFVTHDMDVVRSVADRVVRMRDGVLVSAP